MLHWRKYRPENIAQSIGSTGNGRSRCSSRAEHAKALHNQVKQTFMEEASRRLMNGDYDGLATFFSDDSVYSDGKTYRFGGVDKDGKSKIFHSLDKKWQGVR